MIPSETKLLAVVDEPNILKFLTYNLMKEGFNILSSNNGKKQLK
jgi:DNA-binding response OmpR family regulator